MKINQTRAYEHFVLEKVEHQEKKKKRRIQHFHISGPTNHIPICFLNLIFLLTITNKTKGTRLD